MKRVFGHFIMSLVSSCRMLELTKTLSCLLMFGHFLRFARIPVQAVERRVQSPHNDGAPVPRVARLICS